MDLDSLQLVNDKVATVKQLESSDQPCVLNFHSNLLDLKHEQSDCVCLIVANL